MKENSILEKIEEGIKKSNSAVVQELKENYENYGLSPVLSIDGKLRKDLVFIDESEIEDFEEEVKGSGFKKSDFCLLGKDKTNCKVDSIYEISGTIIIVHKKSGKLREYKAGNNAHWVADFRHDLQNKLFS